MRKRYLRFPSAQRSQPRHCDTSTIVEWRHGEQVTAPELRNTRGEWRGFTRLYYMEKRGKPQTKI